jgi:hypothetical protein
MERRKRRRKRMMMMMIDFDYVVQIEEGMRSRPILVREISFDRCSKISLSWLRRRDANVRERG